MLKVLFSLALAVALVAPAIAAAADQVCHEHRVEACHGLDSGASEKKKDSPSQSHDCAFQSPCCQSLGFVPLVIANAQATSVDTEFYSGYFYSISSTFLDRPFQPPEA